MESAAIGALYAAEDVAEAAVVLAKGLTHPTAPLEAKFMRIKAPSIPRSSHTISVVKNRAYIFGGEISPREPVDNAMHMIILPSTSLTESDYQKIPARPTALNDEVPSARVGHTAAVIGSQIFIFGGRGGPSMAAIEEHGRVWVFDTFSNTWSYLDPEKHNKYPEARSFHASVATADPLPLPLAEPGLKTTSDEYRGEPLAPCSYGTLFIHAGCLPSGDRTNDLWAFDVSSRTWSPLPSAPGLPRGGTSLTFIDSRLYRFGGFDGQNQLGGQVDFLDLDIKNEFNDKSGIGRMAVSPLSQWYCNKIPGAEGVTKEIIKRSKEELNLGNKTGPNNRSVCGFVPVTTGQGRQYLLMICGERTPSAVGHAGAGRFFDDVWSFQVKSEGNTAASWKDAIRRHIGGRETGEAECVEVKYYVEHTEQAGLRMIQEGQEKPMGRRGWFACDTVQDIGSGGSVVVWGGLGEDNQRLGDGWIISVD